MRKARPPASYSPLSVWTSARTLTGSRSGTTSVIRFSGSGWPKTNRSASIIRFACWSSIAMAHDKNVAELPFLDRAGQALAHQLQERQERHDQLQFVLLRREEIEEPHLALHRQHHFQFLEFGFDGPRLDLDLVDRGSGPLEHLREGAHEVGDADLDGLAGGGRLRALQHYLARGAREVLVLERVELGEQLGDGLELFVLLEAALQLFQADRHFLVLLGCRRARQQAARLEGDEGAQERQRAPQPIEGGGPPRPPPP